MPERDSDYLEVEGTSGSIAGSGGTGALDIDITNLPSGSVIVRIHEVVIDTPSTDVDVRIFEDAALNILNRIFNLLTVNLHTVQVLGAGKGTQYQDRDSAGHGNTPRIHFDFTNNQVSAATVTARVRYSIFFAR